MQLIRSRFVLIAALALVFIGSLVYSAARVRYTIDGSKQRSEFAILKASLTDSVRRDTTGALFTTTASHDVADAAQRVGKQPCPT